MDYKEKYEQALEVAKKLIENEETNIPVFYVDNIKDIFTELKESEDEKIRKDIVKYLESKYEDPNAINCNYKEWIAWLEKQSEPKEYTFKSLPRLLDMIEPTNKAKAYCRKLIDTLVKEGYATDAKIVGECLKQMNGEDVPMAVMDEQNPTKLPKGEDYGIDGLYAAIDILQNTLGKVNGYQTDDGILEHKCAISAVKNLYEQKPSWSEEDEKMCQETIDWFEKKCFPYALESENPARESIKWVKSLKDRVQPKREWSEEDEEMLKSAVGAVWAADYYTYDDKQEIEEWLESLKERMTNS